jgi:hypothetical protein
LLQYIAIFILLITVLPPTMRINKRGRGSLRTGKGEERGEERRRGESF